MAQINFTKTLASNATTSTGTGVQWLGGKGMFFIEATGTGTVTIQQQGPSGNWFALTNPNGTAIVVSTAGATTFYVEAPPGQIRAVIATFTGVNAYLCGLNQ